MQSRGRCRFSLLEAEAGAWDGTMPADMLVSDPQINKIKTKNKLRCLESLDLRSIVLTAQRIHSALVLRFELTLDPSGPVWKSCRSTNRPLDSTLEQIPKQARLTGHFDWSEPTQISCPLRDPHTSARSESWNKHRTVGLELRRTQNRSLSPKDLELFVAWEDSGHMATVLASFVVNLTQARVI